MAFYRSRKKSESSVEPIELYVHCRGLATSSNKYITGQAEMESIDGSPFKYTKATLKDRKVSAATSSWNSLTIRGYYRLEGETSFTNFIDETLSTSSPSTFPEYVLPSGIVKFRFIISLEANSSIGQYGQSNYGYAYIDLE